MPDGARSDGDVNGLMRCAVISGSKLPFDL